MFLSTQATEMNPRIQALAAQAGYKPLSPPTFADELNEIFMRKFAELIVKECASLTLDHRTDGYYEGWLDYRDEILKHFGIDK